MLSYYRLTVRGSLLLVLVRVLVFERVDDTRFQPLKTDLGTHPVHGPINTILALGGFHNTIVTRQHHAIAEHTRVLVNLLDTRHIHIFTELVGELLLTQEQLVGVGFSR